MAGNLDEIKVHVTFTTMLRQIAILGVFMLVGELAGLFAFQLSIVGAIASVIIHSVFMRKRLASAVNAHLEASRAQIEYFRNSNKSY